MKRFIGTILIVLGLCGAAAAGQEPALRVFLPTTILVQGETLQLGSLCAVQCDDVERATRASAVGMGRTPLPGEKLAIDRQTILSRLASAGFKASQVQVTGAEKVAIERNEKVITPEMFLKAAEGFLQSARPGPADCGWKLARPIEPAVVADAGDVELKARLAKDSPRDHVKLEIDVLGANAVKLARVEALFKLVYACRQAVAVTDIPAGALLTESNVKIETVAADRKSTEEFVSPYGMVAAGPIAAKSVIRPSQFKTAAPALVVRKSQAVKMRIEGDGFVVTAVGLAISDGHVGELIRVQNVDTGRIVAAKVGADGAVEPVYEEVKR